MIDTVTGLGKGCGAENWLSAHVGWRPSAIEHAMSGARKARFTR